MSVGKIEAFLQTGKHHHHHSDGKGGGKGQSDLAYHKFSIIITVS